MRASAPACASAYASARASPELYARCAHCVSPAQPVAPLSFAIDEDDPFYDEKCDCLEFYAGLPPEATWLLAEEGEGVPGELLAFLRLKHMDGADAFLLEPVFLGVLWKEHLQLPVSPENEKAALADAEARCEAALAAFGGSLQEDLTALAEADKATIEYKLAAVRYAERRALQAASRATAARSAEGALKSLEYYQERRLNTLGLQPIESDDELDALRAAGRQYSSSEFDW